MLPFEEWPEGNVSNADKGPPVRGKPGNPKSEGGLPAFPPRVSPANTRSTLTALQGLVLTSGRCDVGLSGRAETVSSSR